MSSDYWRDLWDLLRTGDTSFIDAEELGPGVAYHYTFHRDEICRSGRLKGAELTSEIGFTQRELISRPATAEHGVVFAYEEASEAFAEGGPNARVLRLNLKRAISAIHQAEAGLGDELSDWLQILGEQNETSGTPLRTVLILADDVVSFEPIEHLTDEI